MLISSSECLSDLLYSEDSSEILSGESPKRSSSDLESPDTNSEESIAGFIEVERHFVPAVDCLSSFQSRSSSLDPSAREQSVAWILKVQAYFGFQPSTAYLSVNYLDRFLYSGRLPVTNQSSGWQMQLLSVACLSLAAKMEEPLVPSLLDLQVEGAKYVFEPRTVLRMELLVLSVLDWRLRSVTPFSFLVFFACKLDLSGAYIGFLISRATEIILSTIQKVSLIDFRPSSIAAATMICAADEIPNLPVTNPEHAESWCDGLSKDKIMRCYQLMQHLVLKSSRRKSKENVLTQVRLTLRTRMRSSDSSEEEEIKITGLRVDDDTGDSELGARGLEKHKEDKVDQVI